MCFDNRDRIRTGPPQIARHQMESEQAASMMPHLQFPEPRLLPHVVSDRAKNASHDVWAALPKSSTDASVGFEDITFARLNYAITRVVCWLQATLGPHDLLPPKALAYIGPPDARYIILTIAAIKAGSKVYFVCNFPTHMVQG
jgi:hypothetical protein